MNLSRSLLSFFSLRLYQVHGAVYQVEDPYFLINTL